MSRYFLLILVVVGFNKVIVGQSVKRVYFKDSIHSLERVKPKKITTKSCISIDPPSDAIVLFNGTNLDAWEGDFRLDNNHIVVQKGGLTSKEKFRDIQLHLEWKINDTLIANGQKGVNSGVFLMNLYEIQILESHLNETYADGQAGAIYGQFPPLVNASLPQGQWNSYDIIFKAPVYIKGTLIEKASATVLHNGIVVQNNQEFEGPTKYKEVTSYPNEHPEKGPIFLQYHGDPIEYRNIWVRKLDGNP
ncbi:DUF1080 domain-containing protein [Lutibacter sp. HS1-25]|uniref:3-keto-disaccharide hydrolase n=1 Tax=Lutibacter sp. HS1-25 TaxID=2485000 RepID=UPI00101165EF|nr:DUF1080 domain-containing protein [Lutibacter sp. HS1-25]RXP62733.1 DUF1080 domain-containing protein [Lutibacter sp. HS1-25]